MAGKKKMTKIKAKQIGLQIDGTKAAVSEMADSIVKVLGAVHENGMADSVAVAAMDPLEAAARAQVNITVQNCHFQMVDDDDE